MHASVRYLHLHAFLMTVLLWLVSLLACSLSTQAHPSIIVIHGHIATCMLHVQINLKSYNKLDSNFLAAIVHAWVVVVL